MNGLSPAAARTSGVRSLATWSSRALLIVPLRWAERCCTGAPAPPLLIASTVPLLVSALGVAPLRIPRLRSPALATPVLLAAPVFRAPAILLASAIFLAPVTIALALSAAPAWLLALAALASAVIAEANFFQLLRGDKCHRFHAGDFEMTTATRFGTGDMVVEEHHVALRFLKLRAIPFIELREIDIGSFLTHQPSESVLVHALAERAV